MRATAKEKENGRQPGGAEVEERTYTSDKLLEMALDAFRRLPRKLKRTYTRYDVVVTAAAGVAKLRVIHGNEQGLDRQTIEIEL